MKIIDEIFKTWHKDYEDKYVTILCKADHIQKGTNLHYFYKPENMPKYFKSKGWYLPKDLKAFYSKFNGMRLFFSSFSIYGTQCNRFFTDNVPYDLSIENINHSLDHSYIVFGATLCQLFAYKNDKKLNGYYKLNENDFSILKTYDSLEELITKELTPFLEEYNLDGTRKHPRNTEIAKKYPVFAHEYNGVKDWEEEKEK